MALAGQVERRPPAGAPLRERRRSPRAALDAWVELSGEGCRQRGATRDVSVEGLGIARVDRALVPGQRLLAEFPLPGIGLPVELEGVVVWCGPPGGPAGIRFLGMDPGLAELLSRHASGGLGD